jgi:hypothetical protein
VKGFEMRDKKLTFAVLFLLAVAVCLLIVFRVGAQQPKPVVYHLTPEASKRWLEIDSAETNFIRQANQQIQEYESHKGDILIGASVPADSRACVAGSDGVVSCKKPEAQPSPK